MDNDFVEKLEEVLEDWNGVIYCTKGDVKIFSFEDDYGYAYEVRGKYKSVSEEVKELKLKKTAIKTEITKLTKKKNEAEKALKTIRRIIEEGK